MTPQTAPTNGNGAFTKAAVAVLLPIIVALIIATVVAMGTVRVNEAAIDANCEAVRALNTKTSQNTAELSEVKGDLKEIKAILLRIERQVEAK